MATHEISRSQSTESSTLSEINEPRAVWAPEGLWHTEPPYTLPPGMDKCPVPTCPNKTIFKPYWRVNEHMKLKHGWPRTQRNPISHAVRQAYKSKAKTKSKSRSLALSAEPSVHESDKLTNRASHEPDGDVDMLDNQNQDDAEEEEEEEEEEEAKEEEHTTLSRPRRSGAKKDYSKLFDPYANPPPVVKQSLTIKLKVRASDTMPTTSHKHRLSDAAPSAHDTPNDTPMKNHSVYDTIDHIAIHEAQSYLFDLEHGILPPLPYSQAPTSTRMPLNPGELAYGLRTFLSNPGINTLISPDFARIILPVYQALVSRAEGFVAANAAALAATPMTPLPLQLHPGTFASPSSGRVSAKARQIAAMERGEPATFTFSGPRERPWNWEIEKSREYERERRRQQEGERRVQMERERIAASENESEQRGQRQQNRNAGEEEVEMEMDSPLSSPLSSAHSSPDTSPKVMVERTKEIETTPAVKTGIKLRLKMTPKLPVEESDAGSSNGGDEDVVMFSSRQYFADRKRLSGGQ